MADESDAASALAAIILAAVYPDGTGQQSAIGAPVTIKRGWPTAAEIDTALAPARSQVIISIYGQNNTESNVSRFQDDWFQLTPPVHTITTAVDAEAGTVTLGGTVSTPQNVAVIVGDAPGLISESYPVQQGDTLTSVTSALAGLLAAAGVPCTNTGPVLTFGTSARLQARTGGYGTIVRELKRQERTFQITIWCNSPEQRDAASPIIDVALARYRSLRYADGTVGRMLYGSTHVLDEKQTVDIYRRDILYRLEYPTVEVAAAAEIIAPTVHVGLLPL